MIHISKRIDIGTGKAWGIRLLAILLGAFLCAILTTVTTGVDPLEVFKATFTGSFGSQRKFWIFLQNTSILLLISLAVTRRS